MLTGSLWGLSAEKAGAPGEAEIFAFAQLLTSLKCMQRGAGRAPALTWPPRDHLALERHPFGEGFEGTVTPSDAGPLVTARLSRGPCSRAVTGLRLLPPAGGEALPAPPHLQLLRKVAGLAMLAGGSWCQGSALAQFHL